MMEVQSAAIHRRASKMNSTRKHELLLLEESYRRAKSYVSEGYVPAGRTGMIRHRDKGHTYERRVSFETWFMMRAIIFGREEKIK